MSTYPHPIIAREGWPFLAIAVVVAETFEQARAAASLIRTQYDAADGVHDLARVKSAAKIGTGFSGESMKDTLGDFDGAFGGAAVKIDATYTTPDEAHAMMEPFATIAAWEGDKLTVWTSNQMINWGKRALASILGIEADNVRVDSPYVGGGFGAKIGAYPEEILLGVLSKKVGKPLRWRESRSESMVALGHGRTEAVEGSTDGVLRVEYQRTSPHRLEMEPAALTPASAVAASVPGAATCTYIAADPASRAIRLSGVSTATTRPLLMMTTRWQVCETSGRMCVLRTIV